MIQIRQPYSFLVEALLLSPDDFLAKMVEYDTFGDIASSMNRVVGELTKSNVSMKELRHYNAEIIDAWSEYVNSKKWTSPIIGRNRSLFEFVKIFGKECLLLHQDEPLFRIEKTKLWQSVSFQCGEDIFVTSCFASKNLEDNYSPSNFQWSYILKSDFFLLNNLIKHRKIVENHYHLWGSAPNLDLSWIRLMNFPYGQQNRFDALLKKASSYYGAVSSYMASKQSDLYVLIKIAARLRIWLYQTCVLGEATPNVRNVLSGVYNTILMGADLDASKTKELIDKYRSINGFKSFGIVVDYAICENTLLWDGNNSFVSGERSLYYNCFRNIYKYNQAEYRSDEVQVLFYLYILIKHRFDTVFIQTNAKAGFHNFKEYQDRKSVFIDSTSYQSMAAKMAISENIAENNIEQLEIRIMPDDDMVNLSKNIKKIDDAVAQMGRNNNFYYVIHFAKSKGMSWNQGEGIVFPLCRESAKRKQIECQAKVISELRRRHLYGADRIVGIDAASNEVNFRPENFGQVFRYLSNAKSNCDMINTMIQKPLPDLRKTYHVGEDFYDIIDGLRAIDEAVMFLELGNGDRIGHGVVLGLDVEKWYSKHQQIAIPEQNRLDNVAWMLQKIRDWNLDVTTGFCEKARALFVNLFNKIYNCNINSIGAPSDLLAYINAWKFRGDNPDCYKSPNYDAKVLVNNNITEWNRSAIRNKIEFKCLEDNLQVYDIIHRYHFDAKVKTRAREISISYSEPELVDLAKQLQIKMRNYVLEKGIAIESCPSSNFLISNMDDLDEIPTFNLFPIRESHGDFIRMNVSINTDDQGVFFTSLQKEFALLAGTLREQKDENGLRIHSDDKILNWVEHLINNGKQQCFKKVENIR